MTDDLVTLGPLDLVPLDPPSLRGWDEDDADAVTVQMADSYHLLEDDPTDEIAVAAVAEASLTGSVPRPDAARTPGWHTAAFGGAVLLGVLGGTLGALALG